MRYMLLVYSTEGPDGLAPEEAERIRNGHGKVMEEAAQKGVLRGAEPLAPTRTATTVRVHNGKAVVTDGPFAETKELIAGFWLWQCKSIEEAVKWLKRCPNPAAGEAEIESRQVFEPEDFGENLTPEQREREERMRSQTMVTQKS